jgi:hypothetical protein
VNNPGPAFADAVGQLRLDALAAATSACLTAAGVEHVLLKGPTTARWLYDPPRPYRDVDMLARLSHLTRAVKALDHSGVASPRAGRLGEEASHAWLLRAPTGLEVDLHVTLPLLDHPDEDGERRLWEALRSHVTVMSVGGQEIPVLDLAGRCLVIALHALASDADPRAMEDHILAKQTASKDDWSRARLLAVKLGVPQILDAATSLDSAALSALPRDIRLLRAGASGAFRLLRIRRGGLRQLPMALWQETFPSRNFMLSLHGEESAGRATLIKWYVSRLGRIARSLPREIRALLGSSSG